MQLARAGMSVLVLERGGWAARDETAWDTRAIHIDQQYRGHVPYEIRQNGSTSLVHPNHVVGGNSVFYGAASFRLRTEDFHRRSRLGPGPAEAAVVDWPFQYEELAPYYNDAERLLGVAGASGRDPCEPPRSTDYDQPPPPFASPAKLLAAAGEALGLRPFPMPLAIDFRGQRQHRCVQCLTCDSFPCRIAAKNDISVTILPEAIRHGAVVRDRVSATRILRSGSRVVGVEYRDLRTGQLETVACQVAVVSCGAISSSRLLLASGLDQTKPNGHLIGRYLMRHCNGIIGGFFPNPINPEGRFHKQVAFTDYYLGSANGGQPTGPWGMLQSLQVPPPEFYKTTPFPTNVLGPLTHTRNTYLICISEDLPQSSNRVTLHPTKRDRYGDPIAEVSYAHHAEDLARRKALYRVARRIMRRAGAWIRFYHHVDTFSHALGTCRAGTDPHHAVLDPNCQFFGLPNLFVVDASFMPTSGAVNPSLTIAANGLRVGEHIVRTWSRVAEVTGP